MKTTYKILFSIDICHDYYNSVNGFSYLEITPTLETLEKLRGFRILYKVFLNKLVALIEVNNNNSPFIPIPKETFFRFYLKILRPDFQNVSELKIFGIDNKIYYFSNFSNNKFADKLYLSKPIPEYDSNLDYEVGSIVQNGSIFEAIQFSAKNSGFHTSTDYWRQLSPRRFRLYDKTNHFDINKGEIRSCESGINEFNIYEALRFISKNNPVDISDGNFWKKTDELQYVTHDDLNSIDTKEKYFGVIDLFFDNTVPADFSILDHTTGSVREVKYHLRFKNRITTWKYISLYKSISDILDVDNIFKFTRSSASDNEYFSNTPIPLLAKPLYNFKITTGGITIDHIRCASSFVIPDKINKSFLSQIFLNY